MGNRWLQWRNTFYTDRFVGAALLILVLLAGSPLPQARAANAGPAWVPGQILAKPRAGVSETRFEQVVSARGAHFKRLFAQINVHVLSVPLGKEQAVVGALSRDPDVAFAELDRIVKPAAIIPDDPYFSQAWDLQTLRLPDAWETTQGGGVIVAVLDTGVDASQPDLVGKVLTGWNVVDQNTDTTDVEGHGTTLAGVIGAVTDNGIGIAAVAPDVHILPVRVTDNTDGTANFSDITAALNWAADHGARVANISFDVNVSIAVSNAAQYMRTKGGVVIVAAGNDGIDVTSYQPDPNMISVSATTPTDTRASFSNYGTYVDLAAPGTDIPVTLRNGAYGLASGTSYSTAIVSGLSALLFAANNALTPKAVELALKYGAVDLGDPGPDPVFGYGRVDGLNSVQLAVGGVPVDTEPPVVTAPPDVSTEATGPTTAVSLGVASAVDNVDGVLTATADTTGPFSVGVHTVTWSATDAAGNTGTATQRVTVTDTTAPVVTAPPDITVTVNATPADVALGQAVATDLVDGSLPVVADDSGPFSAGSHTVTWSATDAHDNTGTATQQVMVTMDMNAPVVTAPADVTVEASAPLTPVTLGAATAVDDLDGTVPVTADNPGPFPVGVTTVTWSATDGAGNTSTATQRVTVTDTTAPVITAPPDVTVEATGPVTGVALGSAAASDLVDGNVAPVPDDPGPFAVGIHVVTWSATDAHGNTGIATQQVIVTDTTAPVVTAPPNIFVEATGPMTSVSLVPATAVDSVSGTLTALPDGTGPFTVGTHVVTWSATDAAGNTGTATQQVTITDTTAPVVTAPPDVLKEATGPATGVALGSAAATDLVDGSLVPTPDDPGPFSVGSHTVTWRATDAAGNTGTAAQQVTITDTTPPQVTAPMAVTVEATGPMTAVALGTGAAVDLVSGTVTAAPDDPGPFGVGTHTVTWYATDGNGNTGTAVQEVIVQDTTPPQVIPPPDVAVAVMAAPVNVALGTATATDLVDGTLSSVPSTSGPFDAGAYTVVWTAVDAHGNVGSATQRVTVAVADDNGPAVAPPPDITVEATGPLTAVALGNASAMDLVDGPLTATPDTTGPFAVGAHTVTWTAVDGAGKTGSAIQHVTVTDTTAPLVTPPADISVTVSRAGDSVPLGAAATAMDLVDGPLPAIPDHGGPFTVGSYLVTWNAVDGAGNVGSAVQHVTVALDDTPPVVTAPPDITVEATGTLTEVPLGAAAALDNVDGPLTATADDVGPYAVGAHTVTWTAVDAAGNKGVARQHVTVVDTTPPAVTPPADLTLDAAGYLTAPDLGTAQAVDLVSGSVDVVPDQRGPFVSGRHTITWRATDGAGNTATATQTVDIIPSANLGGDQVVGRGSDVTVRVYLSGAAPHYPVVVPYQVGGTALNPEDHDAVDGSITIDRGTSGATVFHVTAAGAAGGSDKTVVFSMGDPTGAKAGNTTVQTVTIADRNLAPLVDMRVSQGTAASRVIYADGGVVTVTAAAADPNPGDSLTYDWSGTDNSILSTAAVAAGQLSFDPRDLAAGAYTVKLAVTDNGQPPQSVSVAAVLHLIPTAPVLSSGVDTDGDGIDDAADGTGDDDEDGIPNYLDAIVDPSVLQTLPDNAGGNLLVATSGLHLGLGAIAMAAGRNAAALDAGEVPPLPAGASVATAVVVDSAQYTGGIYDFRVTGLSRIGASGRVVLPLNAALPENARVYVYHEDMPGAEWQAFDDSAGDTVTSASGDNGLCPATGDARYGAGLTSGGQCVQVTITDGGPNDLDGSANGAIQATVAVAAATVGPPPGGSGSPSGGGVGAGATGTKGGGGLLTPGVIVTLTLLCLFNAARGRMIRTVCRTNE
jgi:subtilisin family serine protease